MQVWKILSERGEREKRISRDGSLNDIAVNACDLNVNEFFFFCMRRFG